MAKRLNVKQVHAERMLRWAVKVSRKDGSSFLASWDQFSVKMFANRTKALDYADELGEHIERRRIKAVKVSVTIQEVG